MSVIVKQYLRMLDGLLDIDTYDDGVFEDFARGYSSYLKFVASLDAEEFREIEGYHMKLTEIVNDSAMVLADEVRMLVDYVRYDYPDISSSARRRFRRPVRSSVDEGGYEYFARCLDEAAKLESEFHSTLSDRDRGPDSADRLLEKAESFLTSYKDFPRLARSEGMDDSADYFRELSGWVAQELRNPGGSYIEDVHRCLRDFVSNLEYEVE